MSNHEESAGEPTTNESRGSHLLSTAKHGGIYAIGTVLARMASFIMLPIYTRVLSTEEYGVLEILGLSADVLSMLAGMGIGNAITRLHYASRDEAEQKLVQSTAWTLLAVVFGTVGLTGWIFASHVGELLLRSGDSTQLVRLALIGLLLNVLGDVPLIRFRARQQSVAVVISSLSRLLLTLSLSVVLVVHLRLGVWGVLVSNIIASAVVGGIVTVISLKETGVEYSRAMARSLLTFGAPLMVAQLAGFVLHFSDRYFLLAYSSLGAVGLYSLSYKLAMLLPVFVFGPFKAIWDAKALQVNSTYGEDAPAVFSEILNYYNLVLVTAGLAIALYATMVIDVVAGQDFRAASGPVPILVLAMVFFGYRPVSQVGALIAMAPRSIAMSSAVAAAAIIILNFALIPWLGMYGAALATLGGFVVEFFVMRRASGRVYPFVYPLRNLLAPTAVAALVWGGAHLLSRDLGPLSSFVISSGGLVAYCALLALTGLVSREELDWMLAAVRSPRSSLQALRGA